MKVLIGSMLCILLIVCAQGFCAQDTFNQTLPDEVGGKLEKLQLYFETGLYDEAAGLLDELVSRFPQEERFVYLRGIVDYQRGNFGRASGVFVEFIERYPQVPEPYYLLGEINLKNGDIEKARQYLGQYCALAPENFAARRRLDAITGNITLSSETALIKDGKSDAGLIERIGFYGGCIHADSEGSIKLINGWHRNWSSMGIDFTHPLDLRGKKIILKLKGKQGGERLELTFRDKFAQGYSPQLVIALKEGLVYDWHQIDVPLDASQSKIDLSCVTHLGLEFGSSTVQNPANSTLFVKDVIIK